MKKYIPAKQYIYSPDIVNCSINKLTINTGNSHNVKLLFNNIQRLLIFSPVHIYLFQQKWYNFRNLMIFFFARFINMKSCSVVFFIF